MGVTRAVVYTRISLDPTGSSFSPERQLAECTRLIDARGWTLVDTFEDRDRSAFKKSRTSRPALAKLRDAVAAGDVDVVVAYSISRLARNTLDFHRLLDWLEGRGAKVVCVADAVDTSTAAGRLLTTVISALAQMESELISERVTSAHRVRAERGLMPAGRYRHFGYDRSGEVVPAEAEVVHQVIERLYEGESLYGVCRWLNDQDVTTTAGRQWEAPGLRGMLTSGRLAAYRNAAGGGLEEGSWPAIVDRDEWARLVAYLSSRAKPQQAKRGHRFSGLVACGRCEATMVAANGGKGNSLPQWVCQTRQGLPNCGGVTVTRAPLEAFVLEQLFDVMGPTIAAGAPAARAAELRAAIASDTQALAEASHDRYVRKVLRAADFESVRDALQQRLSETEDALLVAEAADVGMGDLRAWWEGASEQEQTGLLRQCVQRIAVLPAKRGGRFASDRVRLTWKWTALRAIAPD